MAHNRTAHGELQPNPVRFPNGMKALADYVSNVLHWNKFTSFLSNISQLVSI